MAPERTSVAREVRIRARPETVYPFFTEPERMMRWMGNEVEVDPRPGGIYRVAVSGTHVARGEFVELSPPESVVFTWGWEDAASPVRPGTSTVSVTLTADGEETIVRLVHSDLPGEASVEGHLAGWEHYLPRLQIAAAGGDPGPDPGPGAARTAAAQSTEEE